MIKHILTIKLLIIIAISIIGCVGFEGVKRSKNYITLSWDPPATVEAGASVTEVGGYKIYYGPSPGDYTKSIDVGKITTYTIYDLPSDILYFAVTAYDTSGNESTYSNEVSKIIK